MILHLIAFTFSVLQPILKFKYTFAAEAMLLVDTNAQTNSLQFLHELVSRLESIEICGMMETVQFILM